MKILLPLLILIIAGCAKKEEYGSLSGNVYWKYNNYVGDKPDAGAQIKLFSIADSNLTFDTKADVAGNYSFDRIPVGSYLLLITSENTRTTANDLLRDIWVYKSTLEKVFKEKIDAGLTNAAYIQVMKLDSISNSAFDNYKDPSKALRMNKLYEDSAIKFAKQYFDTLPTKISFATGAYTSYPSKVEMKTVVIKRDQNEKVITDFGITYL